MAKSIPYDEYLIESLKDPEEAVGYLNAALEDGDIDVFLSRSGDTRDHQQTANHCDIF